MDLLSIAQVGISVFGSVAFLLVTQETEKRQKLGVVFGLLSNPFWWIMVFSTHQYITIPVHLLYTYGWLRKAWVLWGKSAQQKMHPTLGESAASDSESNPAPKQVI